MNGTGSRRTTFIVAAAAAVAILASCSAVDDSERGASDPAEAASDVTATNDAPAGDPGGDTDDGDDGENSSHEDQPDGSDAGTSVASSPYAGSEWSGPQQLPGQDGRSPSMFTVGWTGSTLVAGGFADVPDDVLGEAMLWTSEDGSSWEPLQMEGGYRGRVEDVSVSETIGLAGGSRLDGSHRPMLWTSAGGSGWQLVPEEQLAGDNGSDGPSDTFITGVSSFGSGAVAVGYSGTVGAHDAAVWHSPDGTDWARVAHDPVVFAASFDQFMSDVIAGGPGLIAVGGGSDGAAVWTSSDGETWQKVAVADADGQPFETHLTAVTETEIGFVAVGSTFDPDAGDTVVVLSSRDGLSWSQLSGDSEALRTDGRIFIGDIAANGSGVAIVGTAGGLSDARPTAWITPDGEQWEMADLNGGASELSAMVNGVTGTADGLVAVGATAMPMGDDPDTALVWSSRAAGG